MRTGIEDSNGIETEVRGFKPFSRVGGFYFRCWMDKTVWILSSNAGLKKTRKNRYALKLGVASQDFFCDGRVIVDLPGIQTLS